MERAEGGKRKTKVCRRTEGTAFKCNLLQSRPKRRVSFVRPRNAHVCPSRSEHACSCTRIDSSSSSSSFSGRMRGNRNGIYVRDNDTRRRIDRSNSKIRSVSIGSRIELLSIDASFQCLPSTTHRFQLSLFFPPSLSTDPLFFRCGDTWRASIQEGTRTRRRFGSLSLSSLPHLLPASPRLHSRFQSHDANAY